MNKNIITIIVSVVVLAGLYFILPSGKTAVLPADRQIQAGSQLTALESMYDFGTISMQNGTVAKNYIVRNDTDKDIKIDSVVTSCMCTNAYILRGEDRKGPFGMPGHGNTVPKANEVIKAGEEWTIEVVFDPAAHGPLGVGLAERSVYIIDEKGGALELKLKAEVTL